MFLIVDSAPESCLFSHPSKDVNRISALSDGQFSDSANKVKQRAERGGCEGSETPAPELCTMFPDVKRWWNYLLWESGAELLHSACMCDSGIDRSI